MSIDDSDAALRIVEAGRQRVIERLRDAFAHQVGATADLGEIDPAALDGLISQAADRAGASLWRISLAEGAADEFGITVAAALEHTAVSSAEQLVGPSELPEPVPEWAQLPTVNGNGYELPEPAVYDTPPVDPAQQDGAAPHEALFEPDADPAGDDEVAGLSLGADEAGDEEDPDTAAVAAEPVPVSVVPTAPPAPAGSTPQAIRIAAVHTGGIETLKSGDKDIELRLSDAGLDVIRRSSGVAIGRLEWTEVTAIELDQGRRRRRRKAQSLLVRTSRGQATFELPGLTDEEASAHLEPMLERLRESGRLGSA